MKPLYITVLSPMQVSIGLAVLFAVVTMVFWVLPAIPRKVDRQSGRCLIKVRAVASFGNAFLRGGGAFYRLSLYQDRMIVCLFTASIFKYEDIRIDREVNKSGGMLHISIEGVRVSIFGVDGKIEEFERFLSERIASSKRR